MKPVEDSGEDLHQLVCLIETPCEMGSYIEQQELHIGKVHILIRKIFNYQRFLLLSFFLIKMSHTY